MYTELVPSGPLDAKSRWERAVATTLRRPNVRVSRTCGARANGWNGAPVLNETTSGKQSVMNMACQNWPTRSSVRFHSSLTNAWRSRKPFVSPSAVPKNSPSMSPDVFAPRASGPVTFPTSRVWMERMLRTGPALMSFPAGSSDGAFGKRRKWPSRRLVVCRESRRASVLMNPVNAMPNAGLASSALAMPAAAIATVIRKAVVLLRIS